MSEIKKLIEVAMPVKEISAESIRDKSIRHGHISTLHLWWARRPLPVCRAVVFACLVPDPLDENCPQAFKDAVELLLGKSFALKKGESAVDWYKPYSDIPWTSAIDPMEDNLRNRLLMFIGKFSPIYVKNEKEGKRTPAKNLLSDSSLIKWDNKNNKDIINIAQKLIFISYQSINRKSQNSATELLSVFDELSQRIIDSEIRLYGHFDRHILSARTIEMQNSLDEAIEAFQNEMPKVFDPFAGGGAIPLEAARLGCRSYGNDINPVAHIIQISSVKFPQQYGKPILYSKKEFVLRYGKESLNIIDSNWKVYTNTELSHINIPNRLSFDIDYYSNHLLKLTKKEIGRYYPSSSEGKEPVAYYWAKSGTCSNPVCGAIVPLLRQFYLAKSNSKKIYLKPIIEGKTIHFEIKNGTCSDEGWMKRANLICPCCGQTTDVKVLKEQSISGQLSDKLLAVIEDGNEGKTYRLPDENEIIMAEDIPSDIESFRPNELMQRNSAGGDTFSWGISKWGQLFSKRQLLVIRTLSEKLEHIKTSLLTTDPYSNALVTYLAILINRVAMNQTKFGLWKPSGEFLSSLFGRQAIPMVFDYPESNPFCDSTGSLLNQVDWIKRYINEESKSSFSAHFSNSSSGEINQFESKSLSAVITDPPYYDAIAYADISDFFYIWFKKTVSDLYPLNFAFPQTPKSEECTALKHHHENSAQKADTHFENKLQRIFEAIEKQTKGIVSIMFAHQSTKAWTTLCNSILGANLNINSSWSLDSEREVRAIALAGAALGSSVTVSCYPAHKSGIGAYRTIRKAIEINVKNEVKLLYALGFRGADLLTACFGPAVYEFGKFERVEKADGSIVTVEELLEMARESAFNAIISDIETDDVSKFYIGWLNLFGFSQAAHDDVRRITQIGLNIDIQELQSNHILITDGSWQTLANYSERNTENKKLGENKSNYTLDLVHKAMFLYQGTNRISLLNYISEHATEPGNSFWRVANSLAEILPYGSDDHKQVSGLITDKESLIRESKNITKQSTSQLGLDFSQQENE